MGEGTEFWKGAKDDTVLKNLTYDAPKVPASYKYSEKTEATGEYTSGGTSSSGGYEEGWPVLIRKRN